MHPPPDGTTFDVRAQDALRRATLLTVIVLGADRRGVVRDAVGRDGMRHLLAQLTRQLEAGSPPGTIVGALDDERVGVAFPGDRSDARRWSHEVVSARRDLSFRGLQIDLELAGGLAEAGDGDDVVVLLDRADAARRRAPRGSIALHDAATIQRARDRLAFEVELRETLRRGGFRLAFQSIVAMPTGSIVASEALFRWTTRWGAPVQPSVAITVADEMGLTNELGAWVIDKAVSRARQLGPVHVNISAGQIGPQLPDLVERTLAAHGVPGSLLALELPEAHTGPANGDLIRVVDRLRDLGCRFGLDDFGAGRSSLAQLRWLPLDFIKIDRSLVDAIDHDADSRDIVRAVARLADDLEVDLIAEGVERGAQAGTLFDLGITLQQGFVHALPANDTLSCGR